LYHILQPSVSAFFGTPQCFLQRPLRVATQSQLSGGFGSSLHSGIEFGRSRTGKGSLGGEEEGGGVRSGPGAARTILLFHIISARPSKQPRMVRTFLKVYMEFGSYFLFPQEQIKDIIIN
jgi:hypothetical protein